MENFKQVRTANAKDLEKFADLLDIAIINLKEAGQHHELGDGSLYTKLQRKLSESMLARYHRWVFENNITESVAALRKWIIQEAEFQTIASETMHGLTGKVAILNQKYNATRKWLDFGMKMWCRTIYLIYIAPLLTKNLWCTVSNVSTARLSEL